MNEHSGSTKIQLEYAIAGAMLAQAVFLFHKSTIRTAGGLHRHDPSGFSIP